MFSLVKISGGISFFHWVEVEVKEEKSGKGPDLCSKDNDPALYPV